MSDDVEPVSSMYIWSGNSVIWPYLKVMPKMAEIEGVIGRQSQPPLRRLKQFVYLFLTDSIPSKVFILYIQAKHEILGQLRLRF